MELIYTAQAKTTGGREGRSVSSDNKLDIQLSTPKELGGAGGPGTNPEQLFAAGYSACFIGAMKFVAGQEFKHLHCRRIQKQLVRWAVGFFLIDKAKFS
ncbi:redox protein regulator of disulfide bond formation-like protein [Shewanella denitrificans OS217]|uniref:Redox protein regulator of disulfide bond formation-like protein n=1 Tax=Shewanella denitrificans (strain OS217 / ATCC BAA-1090 / DSM 15013) TaxID=318161 RepID=Q12IP1_SHEDO|nr:redox protein regulator of disulfide bond formation-like protein [Shewanella denitrificans OS217]